MVGSSTGRPVGLLWAGTGRGDLLDDSPNPPLHFANRLVRQFADNLVGQDVVTLPNDYTVIRNAFRSAGGSWEKVVHGDINHTRLLEKLILAWGKQPSRVRKTEMH